jgi:hypothetical protein
MGQPSLTLNGGAAGAVVGLAIGGFLVWLLAALRFAGVAVEFDHASAAVAGSTVVLSLVGSFFNEEAR